MNDPQNADVQNDPLLEEFNEDDFDYDFDEDFEEETDEEVAELEAQHKGDFFSPPTPGNDFEVDEEDGATEGNSWE